MNADELDIWTRRIADADRRIRPEARVTPLVRSPSLEQLGPAEVHLKLECWQRTRSFKFRGALAKLRLLRDRDGDSSVITASIASELGLPLESLYCMTKGAVLQLARTISAEYRDQGIRCNAVCPGFVKTAHGLREIRELDIAGQAWEEAALAELVTRNGMIGTALL